MADRPAPTDVVDTVVFVHGLWMTPLSWEGWMERFSGFGFEVVAPACPKVEGTPQELRDDPSRIADLGIAEILDRYEAVIRSLDKPPVIIGHSFGGGLTQVLLDRGLGAAAVAISPASPRGVFSLAFSTLRSSFGILRNPRNARRGVPFSPAQFHYAFCNTLSSEESRRYYDRYAVPGAGRVLFEGVKANTSKNTPFQVDWTNGDGAPLLITGATKDHVVPAKVARANHRKYAGVLRGHRLQGVRGPLALHRRDGRLGDDGRRRARLGHVAGGPVLARPVARRARACAARPGLRGAPGLAVGFAAPPAAERPGGPGGTVAPWQPL